MKLFDPTTERINGPGADFQNQVAKAIEPLAAQWRKEGCSLREMHLAAIMAVDDVFTVMVITPPIGHVKAVALKVLQGGKSDG